MRYSRATVPTGRDAQSGGFPERSWLDPRVEVRSSDIEGRGLFATAPIAAGETVAVIGGRLLIDDDRVGPGPGDRSSVAIDEGVNLVQCRDDDLQFGNHSCDPNLWMADAVTVIARRSIAPDEELTIDYALQSGYEGWAMACACGASNCRGTVTGRDWRDPELQRRYAGHWSPFLQGRIDRVP